LSEPDKYIVIVLPDHHWLDRLLPLSQNFDYIEEKVGARPGDGRGFMLTLNPNVSDVVDRFGIIIDDRLSLLIMGSVVQAATGCLCPENALLNSVIRYIRLREDEVVLMDTQAQGSIEHFGRALAEEFQQAVIVTEPGFNAMQVAFHAASLAEQPGIPYIHLVVNTVRSDGDETKVKKSIGTIHPFHSIFFLPFDETVLDSEPDVTHLMEEKTPFTAGVHEIYATLLSLEKEF